jgi:hypothetical protein
VKCGYFVRELTSVAHDELTAPVATKKEGLLPV